jgi:hypothetical protein
MEKLTKMPAVRTIEVPAPTGWPLIASLGIALAAAGLLTDALVSVLGGVLLVAGLVGWFNVVLPHAAHEKLRVTEEAEQAERPSVEERHLRVGEQNHRARLPLEIYPFSAGIHGGLVGGTAMALLAVLYGIISRKSMWYPVNLLAASGSSSISAMTDDQLLAFSSSGLVLAVVIHLSASLLVGVLYSVILPIFPRRPIVVGGIIAPLLWSGFLYTAQGVINPTLNARIDWPWFMAFQFIFGLVAGIVVARRVRIATFQHQPFAVRAGIEKTTFMVERDDDGSPHE